MVSACGGSCWAEPWSNQIHSPVVCWNKLGAEGFRNTRPPDENYAQLLRAFVEAHQHRNQLSSALQVLNDWDRSALPSVPVHGDYWLNNVLGSQNRVTGIMTGTGRGETDPPPSTHAPRFSNELVTPDSL